MRFRKVTVLAAAVAITGAAFAATYFLRSADTPGVAAPILDQPGPNATPKPGETPDTSRPFWHIPYVNQDQQKPRFRGALNGFEIDPEAPGQSPAELCPPSGLSLPAPDKSLSIVIDPGPLRINPGQLPPGVNGHELPEAYTCKGALAQVAWLFSVLPGTEHVNPGGSDLLIQRVRGRQPVIHEAPADRWAETTVGGLPAVVSRPVVVVGDREFGDCFLATYDPASDVMTTISASAATSEFCELIAQEVLQ